MPFFRKKKNECRSDFQRIIARNYDNNAVVQRQFSEQNESNMAALQNIDRSSINLYGIFVIQNEKLFVTFGVINQS